MRTRNSKGRDGEIYALIGGGHGLCVKRDPVYISAESITSWWLESNHLSTYKDIALYVSQTPLTKAGLLKSIKVGYYTTQFNASSDGVFSMALDMIADTLNFPRGGEEE